MKNLLLLCLLVLIPFPASAGEKESAYDRVIRTGTLRCGVVLWPPYFDSDPNTGKITGLGAEIYQEMGKLIDLKIEYTEVVLGQQVEDLNNGRIDAMCNDGPWVFSAIKFVDYSDPAYYSPIFVYTRADDNRIKSASDLNSEKFSVVGIDGDVTLGLAARSFPKAQRISLPAITDAAALMMNVTTKKADATITDPYAANLFNKTNKPGLKLISPDDPVAIYPVGFSVKKGEQGLLNLLNAGLAALWNTNSVAPIMKKYDPTEKAFLPVAKPYGRTK